MCHLQTLHKKYRDKGLVILGFNCSDDQKIAVEFLRENKATFLTILDSSEAATKTGFGDYHMSGVPLNYIIDRQSRVVDAWYGYQKGHKRALTDLEKAGLKIEERLLSVQADRGLYMEAAGRTRPVSHSLHLLVG